MAVSVPRTLTTGRQAAEAGRWSDAFELLSEQDRLGSLEPEDLDRLAWAALLSGQPEACVDARQRAFAAFLSEGNGRAAGFAALNLALSHFGRGAMVVASGWLEQAERHLADDRDCEEHAWLVWAHAVLASEGGADIQTAVAGAEEVVTTGRNIRSVDVEALGLLLKGQLLIRLGEVAEGAGLLDQVMALAVGGCLGPFATAWCYCGTISTCTTACDYDRAWQWTSEVGRCASRPGLSEWPGDCRLHRAELLRVRGHWSEAEAEVARVFDELATWHVGHVATAYYELGELSLRKGDLDAAREAFDRALELGKVPQPGQALLLLLAGETEGAAVAIRDALDATQTDVPNRARLLPAATEVALTVGDLEWARVCVEELEALTPVLPSPAQRARAAHARGSYALARGDAVQACSSLTEAITSWDSLAAPYEAARARVVLAAAQLASGNAAAQVAHLERALHDFERLGAVLDGRRTAEVLGRPPRTARVVRALMFSDIERSTNLLADIGDDAWIDLLRWHDATFRGLFQRFKGQEIHQKSGGDGFFVVFSSPDAGLDCAVAAQNEFGSHDRRLIAVRIGVHWAEVLHADGDFSGRGVHEAARIAALAVGGEILTSTATLTAANKDYQIKDSRRVELRGLPGDIAVASIDTTASPPMP